MNELLNVNIDYENDRITLSARELHEFLEIGTQFKDWFPRMCEYGFAVGIDFNPLKIERVRKEGNREVKRELQDYEITIEMAKEIAMIQRTEKGKQARQYFIGLEKKWNTPEFVMNRALEYSKRQIQLLENKIEEQKPLVEFADHVSNTTDLIDMGNMAKLLKDENINVGRNRLFDYLRKNKILMQNNLPYQRYIDEGYFRVKELTYSTPYGDKVQNKTYVTGKGQIYLTEKLRREFC